MLKTWGIDGLVDMIVGTGGAEIYDYTLDLAKAQYPLDGRLIKSIIKHYEDMDCNIITMAGLGSRFRKAGYNVPKFMITAKEKTLFLFI